MTFWWRSEARLAWKIQQMVLTASPRSPNHRSTVHTAKDMMTSLQKGCNIVRLVVWTGLIDAMANIDRCAVNRRLLAKAVWRRSGRVVVEKIYAGRTYITHNVRWHVIKSFAEKHFQQTMAQLPHAWVRRWSVIGPTPKPSTWSHAVCMFYYRSHNLQGLKNYFRQMELNSAK